MSELTDKLDRLAKHGLQPDEFWEDQDRLAVELADGLRTLLPAHDAEIREQAKREQMVADVQFADAAEPDGWAPCDPFDWLGAWCEARQAAVRAIRAAWAKAHPESEIKEANVAIVPYATVDGQPCDGNGRMLPEAAK